MNCPIIELTYAPFLEWINNDPEWMEVFGYPVITVRNDGLVQPFYFSKEEVASHMDVGRFVYGLRIIKMKNHDHRDVI